MYGRGIAASSSTADSGWTGKMHAGMHATHHPYTHLSCSCQQQVVHVTAIAVRSSSFLFIGVSQLRASTTRIREGMEDAQRQLQKAVETMMDTIHRSKLAPLAKNAYLNMSKCYDQGLNDRQSQECVHSHARYMEAIQSMMQNELNQLQNRLQRGQQR